MRAALIPIIAAAAILTAVALLTGYSTKEALFRVAPAVITIVVATLLLSAALGRLRRRRNDLLRTVARLFDSCIVLDAGWTDKAPMARISGLIDGRQAEFSIWLPRDHPSEIPAWATWGEDSDDDRRSAFGFRLSCASPVEFEGKKWGVSPGPPFRDVRLDPAFTAGEAVNFTTKTAEAFAFWRSRADCRELISKLVQTSGILQISVTGFDLLAWWEMGAVRNWSAFGAGLPPAVQELLELACLLDGHGNSGSRANRKCGRCRTNLGRADVYCSHCGAAWWEEQPRSPRSTLNSPQRRSAAKPPAN